MTVDLLKLFVAFGNVIDLLVQFIKLLFYIQLNNDFR